MCRKKDYPGNKHIKFFKSVNIPSQTYIHTDQPGSKTANEDRKKMNCLKQVQMSTENVCLQNHHQ